MKWIPAIGLFIAAMVCVVLAQAGDNTDAKALAGIFWLPAIGFSLFGAVAAVLAAVF